MRHMKAPVVSQHSVLERTDSARTGRTEKAHGNRHFEQMILPSLGGTGPLLPEWLRKLFRRALARLAVVLPF
jgi:hypothetical protein